LWEVTFDESQLFVAEGPLGGPLQGNVQVFDSPEAARQEMIKQRELKEADGWRSPLHADEIFWAEPGDIAYRTVVKSADELDGYICGGQLLKAMEALLPAKFSKAQYKDESRFAADIAHLPDAMQEKLMHLWRLGAAGELRELILNWSLGYRLTEFRTEELLENFDQQQWMVDLALESVEVFHDGGLAHFHACQDGVRVWCNEWYWSEEPLCDSLDMVVWLAVHQAAANQGTYDPDAYMASLDNLSVTSTDFRFV